MAWAACLIVTHNSQQAKLEIPMDLLDPSAFSPPRPVFETADLVDLLQGKAIAQPEALAGGRPSLANASGWD